MEKNKDRLEGIVQISLLCTIIILIWTIIEPKIYSFNIVSKCIIIIITGIGGIGLYIPIAFKIIELKEKYGKRFLYTTKYNGGKIND
jgi:hypothetical protein